MNRVILCGQLVDRPRWAAPPGRIAIAHLRLEVARHGLGEDEEDRRDEFDCLAFHDLARRLMVWGEPGLRLHLEGRLFTSLRPDERGQPHRGCHVGVERVDIVEPLPYPRLLRGTTVPADPGQEEVG